jgi:murein DD-endopeptidase MepM/ murein hydrolase activator NlpD
VAPRARFILPVAALIGGGAWVAHAARATPLPVAEPIVVRQAFTYVADTLALNETLSELFARHGLGPGEVHAMLAAAPQIDARRMRAGQVFHMRVPYGAMPERVTIRLAREERLLLERRGGAWSSTVEYIAWRAEGVRVTGTVGTSMWMALVEGMTDDDLPRSARVEFAVALGDVYGWVIDFDREMRAGDQFDVLAERLVSAEGEVRFGRIVAAGVEAGGRANYAFGLPGEDGRLDFYDDRGRSLRRAFLKSPLRFGRLSSRFGMRRHPILGRWRNHLGTDYAANHGTEVRATGDGSVSFAGRDGSYGNVVRIRHTKGFETTYAHLRSFARGVRRGARVTQQQVIGYVGATGLANGPHVHYEFRRNGVPLNSRRVDLGDGTPVPATRRAEFDSVKTTYLGVLATVPPPVPTLARADEE